MKSLHLRMLAILLLSFCSLCHAQSTSLKLTPTPLHIGDRMPDVTLKGLTNYSKTNVPFSEFREKLVILDFWMGACKGCILGFPKMEQLQKTFASRVQFIMVNFETQRNIDSTFAKWRTVSSIYKLPSLPSITSDHLLHELFSFEYYPHEVWINGDGKVIAFTSLDEVNAENIQRALDGKLLNIDMKMDLISFDDYRFPLFSQVYPGNPSKLKFYTVLMGYIPGVSGGTSAEIVDSTFGTVRLVRKNKSILELFADSRLKGLNQNPFTTSRFDFGKRVILRVSDTSRYVNFMGRVEEGKKWQQQHCFTYESVMPRSRKDSMYDDMLHYLEKAFNATCYVETRNVNCFALVRTSTKDKIRAKDRPHTVFESKHDSITFRIQAGRLSWLVEAVSKANQSTPCLFTDDSGYTGPVDVEVSRAALSDIDQLNKQLAAYDLKFEPMNLPLEYFIFCDR